MRNPRVSTGPTSPRGIYTRSLQAPGMSLDMRDEPMKKVKKMAKGGSSASKRADGCAVKGKTRGKFV